MQTKVEPFRYNEGMGVRYDNAFGIWLKQTMEEHGIKSSRGFATRGIDVAHTTVESILHGRQPSVETAIKIAASFHVDIAGALMMAGYPDVAALWTEEARHQEPEAPPTRPTPGRLTYELTEEEKEELISSVEGVAPAMRPAALAAIKGLLDNLPRFEEGSPAYGRRPKEEGEDD